jgi:hypothetical protein
MQYLLLTIHIYTKFCGNTNKPQTNKYTKFLKTVNFPIHNLYSSPSLIRVIKSRRMRWAGHAARMGRGGMHIGYWWESQKERDHVEDQDVDGWTILKWILER